MIFPTHCDNLGVKSHGRIIDQEIPQLDFVNGLFSSGKSALTVSRRKLLLIAVFGMD